jgi:hypothetical protein
MDLLQGSRFPDTYKFSAPEPHHGAEPPSSASGAQVRGRLSTSSSTASGEPGSGCTLYLRGSGQGAQWVAGGGSSSLEPPGPAASQREWWRAPYELRQPQEGGVPSQLPTGCPVERSTAAHRRLIDDTLSSSAAAGPSKAHFHAMSGGAETIIDSMRPPSRPKRTPRSYSRLNSCSWRTSWERTAWHSQQHWAKQHVEARTGCRLWFGKQISAWFGFCQSCHT